MIIQQWIYDSNKTLIYYNIFNQLLTELQVNTINRSLPSLLRTVDKFSSNKDLKLKTFTITGINIHIYKRQNYTFVLSTIHGFHGNLFNKFIKFTFDLLFESKKLKKAKNLATNTYFNKKNIANRNMMVKEILEKKEKHIELGISRKVESTLDVTTESKNNRYLIVGIASVGKSSIIAQFFHRWDLEEIKTINPTIMKNTQNIKDEFTNEDLFIMDLGGQSAYRESHIYDPRTFINIRCLIFVLDIQNEQTIQIAQDYCKIILKKLKKINNYPPISVFFHKFDPEKRDVLQSNVQDWMEWFNQPSFYNEYFDFKINFHLTSVFDNSAREAFARTLLFSLPTWLINKTINQKIIDYFTKSVYPVGEQLVQSIEKYGKQKIESELFENSVHFGMEVANLVIKDWIEYVTQSDRDQPITILQQNDLLYSTEIELLNDKKVIKTKINCPLPEKLKNHGSICEITNGLFVGVGKSLGFRIVNLVQTEIRDKAENCIIEFEY